MASKRKSAERSVRHVFVAVLGQTPQIVTETLYALMVERRIPISEVFVITTSAGAERARRDLLDPREGQFFAFCREYGFAPATIAFDKDHILTLTRTPTAKSGRRGSSRRAAVELEDIRTAEDNRSLAEQLLGIVRRLTEDPQVVLHGSIAGGRKTMSAYMLLAFTLYGREWDRLYHVLVPPPFENNPQFFFPPRRERVIGIGVGQVASTRDARIDLAEIPFVRLRPWLLKEKKLQRTVEEQIRAVQRELNRRAAEWESLVIDYRLRQARWGDRVLPISGAKLALLAYFAERRAEHPKHAGGRKDLATCPHCFQGYWFDPVTGGFDHSRYQELCRIFVSHTETLKTEREYDLFLSYRSKLNRALEREGFPADLRIVNISGPGRRGARYGIRLDPRRIRQEGREAARCD